jgi:hypothetical protein
MSVGLRKEGRETTFVCSSVGSPEVGSEGHPRVFPNLLASGEPMSMGTSKHIKRTVFF